MRRYISKPLRSFTARHLPDVLKDAVRGSLAHRLEDRIITYRELIERPDVRSWRFSEAWSVEFGEPDYYNNIPAEITKLFGHHECHRPFVIEIPNGVIFGHNGFMTTDRGEYITFNFDRAEPHGDAAGELAYEVVDELGRGNWPLSPPSREKLPEVDCAIPLLHRWATNYSHWTEEWLTQMEGLRYYAQETGYEPTLLIPPNPPSFVHDSLSVLGYDSDDYVEWGGGSIVVNRLVLPSIRRCRSCTSDDYMRDVSALKWLRDQILHELSLPRGNVSGGGARILISREHDATTRRVVNWEDVQSALARHGFMTVQLTEMDFSEQKRLFSGAEMIVGVHGAGLTELIYAPEAAVIELYGDYMVPVYYEMAKGLNMPYACLKCDDKAGDLVVDLDELLAAVFRMEKQDS
jgi:hypothetical protein